MELVLLEQAKKDIEYWKKSGNQIRRYKREYQN